MEHFNRRDAFELICRLHRAYNLTYKNVESSALKFVEMSHYHFLPYFFCKISQKNVYKCCSLKRPCINAAFYYNHNQVRAKFTLKVLRVKRCIQKFSVVIQIQYSIIHNDISCHFTNKTPIK